jgi:serine/threonine protein kinase
MLQALDDQRDEHDQNAGGEQPEVGVEGDDNQVRVAHGLALADRLTHSNIAHSTDQVEGTTLAERIFTAEEFTHDEIVEWMRQLASAMSYMHGQGVLHRNINPEIVSIDNKGEVKVFGLERACVVGYEGNPFGNAGRTVYSGFCRSANDTFYSECDDMWAVGCILVELLCGTR